MCSKLVRRKLKRQLRRLVRATLQREHAALADNGVIPVRRVNLLEINLQDETLLYNALAIIVPVLREQALWCLGVVPRDAVLKFDSDLSKIAEMFHAF